MGRAVETSDTEIVEVRLREVDSEETRGAGGPGCRIRRRTRRRQKPKKGTVLQRSSHLLGIESLSREQIVFFLDQSKPFQEFQRYPLKKLATLRGKTVAVAFFEASTRTRISFTTAAARLAQIRWRCKLNRRA